jgi:hypothetical protein
LFDEMRQARNDAVHQGATRGRSPTTQ